MSSSDFVNRGQALVASGQFQEAVKVCRLGLLGRPTTVEGRVVLGQALLALKRFDEVLAEMRIAIELDHTSVPSLALKGEALLRKGDHNAAIETLRKARDVAPGDPQVVQLLGEAERATQMPAASASHPSVGFVRSTSTRNYPGPPDAADDEETGDAGQRYTRETSIAAPAARDGRSKRRSAVQPATGGPSANQLAVGDKSGTVEVDPELEGVRLDDDDIGALSPPPSMRKSAAVDKPRGPGPKSGDRAKAGLPAPAPGGGRRGGGDFPRRDSGVELDSDDLIDVDEETPPPVQPQRPGAARSAVRASVGMVSGPLDQYPVQPQASLAQAIAGTPHVMQVTPVSASPQVPQSSPRAPTMMPQQLISPQLQQQMMPPQLQQQMMPQPPQQQMMPQPPVPPPYAPPPSPASYAAAAMPTMAIAPPQGSHAPWAQSTVVAGNQSGMMGSGVDPALAALAASVDASTSGSIMHLGAQPAAERGPLKTGMRKARSPVRVLVWILLGAAVIGGGVFAGFQIRAMRLGNQIESARVRATALAKEDTWAGWAAARDGLAGIVQAANTADNRAALARARASIAFEFGDGLPEAKQAVDALKGAGGLDGQLATAYLALASDDPKTAKTASDAALAIAPTDAAALYVSGRAQLLGGDASGAVAHLKAAVDKDPRALYMVGLARAYDAANAWDDGLAVVEKALTASPDNPAALIERAELDAKSGRIQPGGALGMEVRAQLDKIIGEGARPLADQARGVSLEQIALANLAVAHVQIAANDHAKAFAAVKAALALGLDDQRVVEGIIGVFYGLDDLTRARTAAEKTLEHWPNSRLARIELAQSLIELGRPDDAIAALKVSGEVTTLPIGLVVRGDAKLANADLDGARADYDAALKREPKFEAAMIGRVAVDLAAGKVDDARKLIEPRFTGKDVVASLALETAWASVLRSTGDAAKRDTGRVLIEKAATGQPDGHNVPDVVRAQVELARIYRDSGDLTNARRVYGDAAGQGSIDAQLDAGLLEIDERDPRGGYDTFVQLLKSLGPNPPANVVLATARAAMLVGDHAAAAGYLAQAEKARGLIRWQLDREQGRFAFRRGDIVGAAAALTRALDACGPDTETLLLAADVVYADLAAADDKTPPRFAELQAKLVAAVPERIATRPEAAVVTGILALAANKLEDAKTAYDKAAAQFDAEKATSRRRARATYGLAILSSIAKNLPEAKSQLDVVVREDPTTYSAYLYYADVESDLKDPKGALADALKSVAYNPDLVDGWYLVGKYAHDAGDKKTVAQAVSMINAIAPDSPRLRELQQLH